LEIFPNPSDGNFSFHLPGNKTSDIELTILDQTRRVVFQSADLKSETFALDLAAGVYLVNCKIENITLSEQLIISE
jgi:Secretion system C-terminal sorting domain